MRLLFAAIIIFVLVMPIGINLQKLSISLSWNEEVVVDTAGTGFAMATDRKGVVHVAFRGPHGLTYTNNSDGNWVQHVLGGSPYFCGIDVDVAGRVHIAAILYNTTGRDLAYVTNAQGYWESSVIHTSVHGYPVSIATDSEMNAHISYTKGCLLYATNRDGGWNISSIAPEYHSDWSSDLAVDSQDRVHIVAAGGHIGYFIMSEGNWTHETVFCYGLVQRSVSIAIDTSDIPHVIYFGGSLLEAEGGLQYAVRTDGMWTSTTVEKLESYSPPSCSIAVDDSGGVHITYVKLETDELKYVRIIGDSQDCTVLDKSARAGCTACAVGVADDGHVRVSYTNDDRTLLYVTTEPPHMFLRILLNAAIVKAAVCMPFVALYALWWRRRNLGKAAVGDPSQWRDDE